MKTGPRDLVIFALRGGDYKGLAVEVPLQFTENLCPKIHRVRQYLTQELVRRCLFGERLDMLEDTFVNLLNGPVGP